MNRGGFSWNRLLGVSRMKSNLSRKIGIPLTQSGRERKIGRMVSKGCLGSAVLLALPLLVLLWVFKVFA
jgi:hypothetical protein